MTIDKHFSNLDHQKMARLFAEKMKRENPNLIKGLFNTIDKMNGTYQAPWYARAYEGIKKYFGKKEQSK